MLFLGLIVSIYFNLFAFPWALYYKIEFKNLSKSFSQYVVVEVDKVTSIEFDDSKKYLVSSFCFSNSDSIVSIKTINHKSKTFFYHEIKYSEFLDSMKHNTVNSLNNEGDIIQFVNKNKEIEFTAHLSDSLPNVYPKTIMMEDIKALPVRIDFPNRVSSLKNVIESKDEINLVLLNIETKGYKLINLADLKKQLSEKSGYSFEEIENKIKSLKQ